MTKKVHEASTKSDDDFVIETVEAALNGKSTEALATLKINNKKVKVKLDTGAEVNVMLVRVFKQMKDGHVKMERTKTKLCGYGGTRSSVNFKMQSRNQNSMWRKQIQRHCSVYRNPENWRQYKYSTK